MQIVELCLAIQSKLIGKLYYSTLNVMKEFTSLCWMLLNRDTTALVFFHQFSSRLLASLALMRSRSCLLIMPISALAGLIRRHVGLLAKLGLWSLRVMNALCPAMMLILSSRCSFLASDSFGLWLDEIRGALSYVLAGLSDVLLQQIM